MDRAYSSGRRLQDLLAGLEGLSLPAGVAPDTRVAAAHSDSRRIGPRDVFIALPGSRSQGVDYLARAFGAGAAAALVPAGVEIEPRFVDNCIPSANIRRDAARLACAVYGHPTEHLLCFGVTGTNGKTSTCHILAQVLRSAGHRVLLVTTVAHEFEDWHEATPNTTPDAALLQSVLARARQAGATAAVLEVSAHAVALERVGGCRFDGLVFTNLAPDHQDFFDGMEPYFRAKRRLFVDGVFHKPGCVAAVGCDDEFGRRLLADVALPSKGFGVKRPEGLGTVDAGALSFDREGLAGQLCLDGLDLPVRTTLAGAFNRCNLAGAFVVARLAGVDEGALRRAATGPMGVPGRLMAVRSNAPFRVIVDFAHTASALGNLLDGLRQDTPGRLMVLFGAGGDKDPARRRTLPEVAFERADLAVITLDNPRSEDPASIIDTMVAHWNELCRARPDAAPAMHVEPDRRAAIAWLLAQAREGDTVVLAGKGHETTQEFADRVEPHDDSAVARTWLAARYP
jgi:UDP-N-acetylmuramoyl-L-alanyl-D-glutamate--2,6-diaminopimelate ligase